MSNNILNEIIVLVTKGCESCEIAKNLVKKAVDKSDVDINLEIYDCTDSDSHFMSLAKLYLTDDFPTTIFVKRGIVISKIVGTTTVDEITKEINKCFKQPIGQFGLHIGFEDTPDSRNTIGSILFIDIDNLLLTW